MTPLPTEEEDYDWSTLVLEAYPSAQIEVGYLLIPDAWGQGFATEACKRLLRLAFEQTGLTEVVATTDPDNLKFQHVLQKSGLKNTGFKHAYAEDDLLWFEITRDHWKFRSSRARPF